MTATTDRPDATARSTRRPTPTQLGIVSGAVGLVVFLVGIGTPAYWLDEATTAALVQRSWPALAIVSGATDPALGFYYALVKPFGRTVGAEAVLRFPSALAAALVVGLVTWFAARWTGRWSALVAAGLMVVVPTTSRYAQEARPYALAALAATCVVLTWWQASRPGASRRWWWCFGVAVLAVLLLNSLALTVVVGPFAAALLSPADRRRELLRRTAVTAAIVLVVASPALFLIATRAKGVPHPVTLTPVHVWQALSEVGGGDLTALFALLAAAVGVVLLARRRRDLAALLGSWAFAGPVLLVLASLAGKPFLVPRYYFAGLPAIALLVGVSVAAVVRPLLARDGAWRAVAVALPVVLVLGVAWVGLPGQRAMRGPAGHADDVRPLVAALEDPARSGVPVVVTVRVWVLSIQAYAPQIVDSRMPTIAFPRPRTAIAPSLVPPAQAEAALSALARVALVVRTVSGASAPMPDSALPAGLRGRGCTQTVTHYAGWDLDDLVCPRP